MGPFNSDIQNLGQFDRHSGWDNSEGPIGILTAALFANVFLPLGIGQGEVENM